MDWADDTAYSLNDIVDGANAGFINLQNLENWAETNNLKGDDAKNLEQLCKSIRRKRLEPLMGRKVGDFIAAANIVDTEKNFMSSRTARYKYKIDVSSEIAKESKLYKKISLDLVFKSPQLQQLDHKAARVLGELFNILSDNYISNNKKPLKLVSSESEELISIAEKDSQKARVITDIISEMTDKLAVRTYRRLVDPNFGSILDLV
jgi:dGTPase